MLPYILMIIGVICITISVIGALLYILEPLYRSFQIVIKRKDDYSHFNTPAGLEMLQRERRRYWAYMLVFFAVGMILFYSGYRLAFGDRGLNTAPGEYVSEATGEKYDILFVVHGKDVHYKGQALNLPEDVDEILEKEMSSGKIIKVYIQDDFAVSSIYHELIKLVNDKGCTFEYDR
ncbi:MAG: hypothetical protein IKR56_02840 [Lachnospiraceae bacterium]|nr:hypothetical protein [Lachnospiraceae bacterium]